MVHVLLLLLKGYCDMLAIDVTHGCQIWEGMLVASLIWKLAWHLLGPWKLVPKDGVFNSVLAQGSLGPVYKMQVAFSISTSWGWPRETVVGCMLLHVYVVEFLGQPAAPLHVRIIPEGVIQHCVFKEGLTRIEVTQNKTGPWRTQENNCWE